MSVIDDIKEKIDLVELIQSSGVNLRRTGRSYVGFCPFHPNSRTPAFTVYPDTQSFYCFGCHASGSAFDFLMRRQGLDFRDALQQLATQAGVKLEERGEEERQEDARRTRLLDITSAAAKYFNYVLLNLERGQAGRDYIAKREISPAMVEAFQLGFSLEDWGHLLRYLTEKKGFEPEEVEAAGLAIHHEQRGYYDRFRGRLIFPIRNARGQVIGFGGRALGDAQPKYLNTPQTLLFDKSQVLYGLDLAREAIRADDATVVVEGYVDVITAHQHGFRNVVAPLGTALTRGHIALLKKLSHNLYLALDADAAGQKATLRGLSVLQEVGEGDDMRPVPTAQGLVRWQSDMSLRIIAMPEGRDPDEVIRAEPERWRELIAAARPVMDFYIEAYTAGHDLGQPLEQREALEKLLPLLAQLDTTQQRVYIARLEQIIGVKAELILDLVRGNGRSERGGQRNDPSTIHRPKAVPGASAGTTVYRLPSTVLTREDHLLALVLRYPATCAPVEELTAQELQSFPKLREMFGWELASLLERTENRMLWRVWLETPPPERPTTVAALTTWAQRLDEHLRSWLDQLLLMELPAPQEYRYRQEAEKCARIVRTDQARAWVRRLTTTLTDIEDEEQRIQSAAALADMQRYLNALSLPRRSSSFPDMRDLLGKE